MHEPVIKVTKNPNGLKFERQNIMWNTIKGFSKVDKYSPNDQNPIQCHLPSVINVVSNIPSAERPFVKPRCDELFNEKLFKYSSIM